MPQKRFRIRGYEPEALLEFTPGTLYEGPTNLSNDELLRLRDTDLGFDIDHKTAQIPSDAVSEDWPRFTLEVQLSEDEWQQIGTFDIAV